MHMPTASLFFIVSISGLLAGLCGCATTGGATNESKNTSYRVQRLSGPITIDADWDKAVWKHVPAVELTRYMGKKPAHFPRTQAKVLYDDQSLYVIFRVEDQYVRAVARQHDDPVCRDSCVEFFFVPGMDVDKGYFNLEMNCGGTMLFHFQTVPRQNGVRVADADLARMKVAHTLSKNVDPEIAAPTTWVVEYRLPLDILSNYGKELRKPAPGVTWRANFYKCADDTSHPHWLTWSKVENPHPDFHIPQFFGTLRFE